MALHRLENTEKRLKRSPDVAETYSQCIEQYIEKGYVRKVPVHEQSRSKWYLPHFPVIRLDKDTTKTRIVFDESAECGGVSLNDVIHQGPKLQRDLFGVLLRFRRFPVALVYDIAEMYLRIGIAAEDKQYHRFLWRGIDKVDSQMSMSLTASCLGLTRRRSRQNSRVNSLWERKQSKNQHIWTTQWTLYCPKTKVSNFINSFHFYYQKPVCTRATGCLIRQK